MKSRVALATLAGGLIACGGSKRAAALQSPTDTPKTTVIPAALAAPVVEVRMTGNGTTTAANVPSRLTIKPGTTVRFINASGGRTTSRSIRIRSQRVPPPRSRLGCQTRCPN